MKHRLIYATASLLFLGSPAAAQTVADSAGTAWRAGETDRAYALYGRILAADSLDEVALHRFALMEAWRERYSQSLALFARLIRAHPANFDARLDRARVIAWSGNPKGASLALDSLLMEQPRNVEALQARAQFLSWAGDYSTALGVYDRILEINPTQHETRIDRARTLAWAEKFTTAGAVYDSLLRADPNDRSAKLGLAQVMTLSGNLDSSYTIYSRMVALDARDIEALRGLARVNAWDGRLVEAEKQWRAVIALDARNAESLLGLAQTLRWQGRDASAAEQLVATLKIAPNNADAHEQLRLARQAMASRASPSVIHETDSDHNRITTTAFSAAFHVRPRVELRGDAYYRNAGVEALPDLGRQAYGGVGSVWMLFEPGWTALLGAGASTSNVEDANVRGALRVALTSPGRNSYGFSVNASSSALDGSAALIERRVRVQELGVDARWTISGFQTSASAGVANFHGDVSDLTNNRWNAQGVITRRIARPFTAGLRVRGFGFSDDLNDAYFDPDFYGLAELTTQYVFDGKRWSAGLEAAPGAQRVRSDGDISGSLRGSARVGYSLGFGRQVGLNAVYAKSGLQQLSPTADADYRYFAIGLTGTWTFPAR